MKRLISVIALCVMTFWGSFRHISYDAELKLKQNTVKQAFARIAKMDIRVNETVFDDDERYRNKV